MPRSSLSSALLVPLQLVPLLLALGPATARADDWQLALAAGFDGTLAPDLLGGHGFVLGDAVGRGVIGGGNLHAFVNTDTAQVGVERLPLGRDDVQLSVAVRGEALFAGLLGDYYRRGDRRGELGFEASYLQGLAALQWHAIPRHSLDVQVGVRRWFFGRASGTSSELVLPPEAVVVEPRIGWVYWAVDASSEEWEAHRLFPRITGIATGFSVGADLRTEAAPWGGPSGDGLDPRNDPDTTIPMLRQWMRAGWALGSAARLQVAEQYSMGHGEDDLTRNRVGGMTPYVVTVPGLPWASILSERLLAGEASLHLRLGGSRSEIGVLLAGAAFTDPYRVGDLSRVGGAGGVGLLADLRFGVFQLHVRAGYAFPAPWQADPPHLSGLVTFGARVL